MKNNNLGSLLSRLTMEGRAQAIYQILRKSSNFGVDDVPKNYASEAVGCFEKNGNHRCAALVAERIGLNEEAAINYKKAGLHEVAQPFAEKVLKQYQTKEEFDNAAKFAEKMEMYYDAASNYERAGLFGLAAKAAEKGKLNQQVDLYNCINDLIKNS